MKYYRLTSAKQFWAPHYNEPKCGGSIPEGTIVFLRAQLMEPWEDAPRSQSPRGHNYWLLEWEEAGVKKSGWTRTYDFQLEDTFLEEIEMKSEDRIKALRDVLKAIRAWDVLNPPSDAPVSLQLSDGPYFCGLIDKVLEDTAPIEA